MSMTLETIRNGLEKADLGFSQQNGRLLVRSSTDHYRDRDGDPKIAVGIRLTDDGERLTLHIPYAFQLEDDEARGRILRPLLARQFENRFIRYEFDPEDGEVRMNIDLILADNVLAEEDCLLFMALLVKEAEEVYQQLQPLRQQGAVVQQLEAAVTPAAEPRAVDQLANLLSEFSPEELQQAIAQAGLDVAAVTALPAQPLASDEQDIPEVTAASQEALTLKDPVLLIRLTQTYRPGITAQELYEATRGNWAISLSKAQKARYAYALHQGMVLQVYRIDQWNETDELSGHGAPRLRFTGTVAEDKQHHVGCSLAHYFQRGEASPVKYLNC